MSPGARPPLHKHHLAARLVLVVLALARIYHPARRERGVKTRSFAPKISGFAHRYSRKPDPNSLAENGGKPGSWPRQGPPQQHLTPPAPFLPPSPLLAGAPVLHSSSQASRGPRPAARADPGQWQRLLPLHRGGQGQRLVGHPQREVARKRCLCRRSPPLPQAEQLPENLQQPQRTHSQPGLRHCARGLRPHRQSSTAQREQVAQRGGDENETSRTFAKRFTSTFYSLCWQSRFQIQIAKPAHGGRQ